MLDERTIPIAMGQGLDTKSDPKLSTKPVLLENGVFNKVGRTVKRPGNDAMTLNIIGGGSLSGPQCVRVAGNELVAFDGGNLYAYSPEQSGWINRGRYPSIGVSDTTIGTSAGPQSYQSAAVLGTYALFTYNRANLVTGQFETHVSVLDIVTNALIVSDLLMPYAPPTNAVQCAKAVALGSTTLAIVFSYNNSGAANISICTVSISSSGVSFGGVNQIGSDVVAWSSISSTDPIQFDVATTANGAVVAYASSSVGFLGARDGLKVKTITTAGFVGTSVSISSPGQASPISVVPDASTGNTWVNWVDASTPTTPTIYTTLFDPSLSSILGKTSVVSPGAPVNQITGRVLPTFAQSIYFSKLSALVPGGGTYNLSSKIVNPAGSVSSGLLSVYGLDLASKPFQVSGKNYLTAVYYSGTDQALFVLSLDTLVASQPLEGQVVAKAFYQNVSSVIFTPSFIVNPIALSSTKIGIVAANILQGAGALAITGTAMATLDYNHPDAFQGKVVGTNLILNGGIVQMYDGNQVAELGFHYPPVLSLVAHASGGSMADGTYGYAAVYQWSDANGKLHQSAPAALSVTIAGGGGSGSVSVTATYLRLTAKNAASGVSLVLFRTDVNGIGHYQMEIAQPNLPSSEVWSITDGVTSYAGSAATIYTDGNVLPNSAPPPALVMETHNNRLWLIDSENPNTFWPSKIVVAGEGVSFAGNLSVDMDERGGPVTAMAELDSNFVFFKASLPFIVSGDAADATGANSSLSVPTPILSDVGAVNSKGVASYPDGVLFKTAGGGIYRLDRALGITYWGNPVEQFNGQNVTAANRVLGTTQIRFLTSSGSALVYDYFFNQWTVFTNYQGYGADTWNGKYVYARTDGNIYLENATSFLDGSSSYQVRMKIAWIKTAGIQGFQRIRRIGLLGDYGNGTSPAHGVQVSAAYDYGTTFSTPVPYLVGSASSAGVYQYLERLAVQKCESVQLLIEEIVTGASGEWIGFTDLTAGVAVKRGIWKAPQTQSVG